MGRPKLLEKMCKACGVTKLRTEFGEHCGNIREKCRACAAACMREWRKANPGLARERKNAARKRNPASHYAYNYAWGKTERGLLTGRNSMRICRAIKRGLLTRASECEWCGRTGEIQAAHEDYSRPLDVKWLCRFCHARWDHEYPKTIGVTNGD